MQRLTPALNVRDFIDPHLPRAVPYGVYDLTNNVGWVSVGTDHDTASFAVNAIRRWWTTMGKERHPKATRLMITADGGGRIRLWKIELQNLANELKFPSRQQDPKATFGGPTAFRTVDRLQV